jgi:hypothetical protein
MPKYSDLDLDFKRNPVSGDIGFKYDAEAVKRSVRNLILLQFYEKPFHPEINSKITSTLFEFPDSPNTEYILKESIGKIIKDYEPRIQKYDIKVYFNPDSNFLAAEIAFTIYNIPEVALVRVPLVRTR